VLVHSLHTMSTVLARMAATQAMTHEKEA